MGHLFCRSWIKVRNVEEEEWASTYTEQACFGFLKGNLGNRKAIRVLIKPTTVDQEYVPDCEQYKCRITMQQAEQFVQDVLDAMPNVCTRLDTWEFEYPMQTKSDFLRLMGVGTLIRYVEEWWCHVENYFNMRERGIPRDVALAGCCLDELHPAVWGGHSFLGSWATLKTLKNFNLVDAYLKNVENNKDWSSWRVIYNEPFFRTYEREFENDVGYNYPSSFRMTREIYEAFVNDNLSVLERQTIINGQARNKVYRAII